MFTGLSRYKNSGRRGMYNFRPLHHNGSKVRMMKADCKGKEERERPARRVWGPAAHISALLNTSCVKRGTVRRETPRTATGTVALPNHSPASHLYTIISAALMIHE